MTAKGAIAELDLGVPNNVLLAGFGLTNQDVAKALLERGHTVTAFDDKPDDSLRGITNDLNIALIETPAELDKCLDNVDFVVPTPGLNENHPLIADAQRHRLALVSEFDLAAHWDKRPILAITGTNGKTTVVELATLALTLSGVTAVAAGNNDLPLVAAINRRDAEVFVVEASSFRLAHCRQFTPQVATWLNFAPDHLDVHRDLASYERAKSQIWRNLRENSVCVANALDPLVMTYVRADRQNVTFAGAHADWRVEQGHLTGPQGPFTEVADLWRSFPHDIEAALAVAASVTPLGASLQAVAAACRQFSALPHRIKPVGEIDGSIYYDDSKSTTPHATLAALRGFGEVVLIAGGRNKGIDLAAMTSGANGIAAVVAIGEAASEIAQAFGPTHHVEIATDMTDAVSRARNLAKGNVPVLFSPGCASFDWYENYRERGKDFIRVVGAQR